MPIELAHSHATLLMRRGAFEDNGMLRSFFDERLGLTADEFTVEGDLIAIGPIYAAEALGEVIAEMEAQGLVYFDDFFDFSGNWPEWLSVYVMAARQAHASGFAGQK